MSKPLGSLGFKGWTHEKSPSLILHPTHSTRARGNAELPIDVRPDAERIHRRDQHILLNLSR
jgi:hypothetical protein